MAVSVGPASTIGGQKVPGSIGGLKRPGMS
jgi:hypothetical protein